MTECLLFDPALCHESEQICVTSAGWAQFQQSRLPANRLTLDLNPVLFQVYIPKSLSSRHFDPIAYYRKALGNRLDALYDHICVYVEIDFNKHRSLYFDNKYQELLDILELDKTHELVLEESRSIPLFMCWTYSRHDQFVLLTFGDVNSRRICLPWGSRWYHVQLTLVAESLRALKSYNGTITLLVPKEQRDIVCNKLRTILKPADRFVGKDEKDNECLLTIETPAEKTMSLVREIQARHPAYETKFAFDAKWTWSGSSTTQKLRKHWCGLGVHHNWPLMHSTIVDVCLALQNLNVYTILFIIDWLPFMWLHSRMKKVQTITNVCSSIAKVVANRTLTIKEIKPDQ